MVVNGIVSGVETKQKDGVALTTFRLRSSDGRETQAQIANGGALRNGASVQVEGEIDSELVLIATSFTVLETGSRLKPQVPWKLVGIVGVLVLALLAWFATRSGFSKQSSIRFEYPTVSPALIKSSPSDCELACKNDAQCGKYTWVHTDGIAAVTHVYGHQPTCWLLPKAATQATTASDAAMGAQPDCCISAVKN